jgi:hypothetical protein
MKDNVLEGTPHWNDIGKFLVNVSVEDEYSGSDHHTFLLTVNNLNDPPRFLHVPSNSSVDEGAVYSDIAEAMDLDEEDAIVFSIRSNPVSDITIDPSTGLISWMATTEIFDKKPYVLFVYITIGDGTLDITSQFRITVNETPIIPSKDELISPQDASKVKLVGSSLEWVGTPGMAGELSYTVYLHQTMAYVVNKNSEAVYLHDYSYTKIDLTNLEAGKKYYWTVIPTEGGVTGSCTNGIRSFFVNNIPTYTTPVVPKATQGVEFTLKVQGDDLDQEDSQHLKYTLLKKPDGMTIGNQTGLIRWTPGKDQVGNHEVEVSISDGMEATKCSFVVEAIKEQKEEPKDNSGMLLLSIGIILVVLFLVGMAIVIVVLTRRKEKPKEVKEAVIGSHGEPESLVKTGSTVPTTLEDAYIRPAKPRSYQEMYGTNPPSQEEALSAQELKDSLNKDIWKLEHPEE